MTHPSRKDNVAERPWVRWSAVEVGVNTRTRAGRKTARGIAHDLLRRNLAAIDRPVVGEPLRACPVCTADDHGMVVLPRDLPDHYASISYAASTVAVALSYLSPVGIDVEVPAALPTVGELDGFLAMLLTPGERRAMIDLTRCDFDNQLLDFWTGKEAVLKMHGRGVANGLAGVPADRDGSGHTLVRLGQVTEGVVGALATACNADVTRTD